MPEEYKERVKVLLALGEEIYNQSQCAEAMMYLGYALGMADQNKKAKNE